MLKRFRGEFVPVLLAGLAVAATPIFAQGVPAEGPVPTTAVIRVQSKTGVTIDPANLKLQVNGHESPITSVTPVAPAAAQVAILIDEGLRASFGNKVADLADFINQLPAGMQVLVGYMQNGTVIGTHGFSANHAAIANALRLPTMVAGVDASPYFCLSDFVKHWPSNRPAARFVLMITNGIDPYNGRASIMNQNSPYVQTAQEDAQRAGVAVYSIYYGQSFPMRARGSFSGQSYLMQVAEATGGNSFNQGTITPPSLTPYLDQFGKALARSYMVSFNVNVAREKPNTLTQIRLTTRQPGIKIHAPQSVHPGLNLQ